MRAAPALLLLALACCQRSSGWGSSPVSCHVSSVSIGSIEGFAIDGSRRSVSFRHAPDVWLGSDLIERDGRLTLKTNEIGVESVVAEERPGESSVRLSYAQRLPDGGINSVEELLRCQRLSSP